MRIVAIDPGGTTGVAEVDTKVKEFNMFQLGPDEHHEPLWDYLCLIDPDVVVCERFNYQRRELEKGVSLRLDSREYIGVCKLYTSVHGNKLVLQQPSTMGLWTDAKLKRLKLYVPGRPHATDAVRHLLYYITTELKDDSWIRRAREPE